MAGKRTGMQVSVTGKGMQVGDALREHVRSALTNVVEKYFGNAMDAEVVVSREGGDFRVDVSVHVGRGIQLRGHETGGDAHGAFDAAALHLEKRLRRHKRRVRNHHNTKEIELTAARSYVLAEEDDGNEPEGADTENPTVVAENTVDIERLSVSQAVMRLDLGQLPVKLFRNARHGGLNVVYRRPDGHIGWIDPGSD